MKTHYELVIVGAGPAGMAAASVAADHGMDVLLIDEQAAAGGQIYRGLGNPAFADKKILGAEYYQGQDLLNHFTSSQAEYVSGTTVWQVSAEREIGISCNGTARLLSADQIILATGAQERPFPVPGWTLPGVMGAGAAQVLLKASGLASADAVFAGTGPLLYLIAHQYLRAGVPVRAIVDIQPKTNLLQALPHLPAALLESGSLLKGRRWIAELKAAGIPFISAVDELKISGDTCCDGLDYKHQGRWQHIETAHVFLHQGVVPNVNLAMAAGCTHNWSDAQLCWHALTDEWGLSDVPGIVVAGDGAAINGAVAAESMGRIAAYGALQRCGYIDPRKRDTLALSERKKRSAATRIRPFLDALFQPPVQFRVPVDDATLVCRCEEVTAARVRESVELGCLGPNQLKSFSRCGMGPCQGRFCGLTVSEMIAQIRAVPVAEVGAMRLRPPVKPLLLGELAALDVTSTPQHRDD